MKYTNPEKKISKFTEFDKDRTDEYFWLRNIKDDVEGPVIKNLLDEENQVTNDYLSDVEELKNKLFEEMKSRELEEYSTHPYKHGDFYYYERYESGKEYAIHCRKRVGSDEEQICLDENELANGHDYFDLGVFEVSTDHKILAYTVDTDGSEIYTLKFKNLETGEIYADEIKDVAHSISWFKDSYSLVYVIQNEQQRPYKALQYTLGENKSRELYEEKSGEFFLSVTETSDHEYIIILAGGSTSSEAWILKGDNPKDIPTLFHGRENKLEYYPTHKDGKFYILTNDTHENFRIAVACANNFSKDQWKDFVPASDEVLISDIECYQDFFTLNYRESGLQKLKIIRNTGVEDLIDFPEAAYVTFSGENAEYKTDFYRFEYTSLTQPMATFDYDLKNRTSKKVYEKPVPGFDPEVYKVDRLEVESHDGAMIPISIVYKKDIQLNGEAPCLLYGYGSYGYSVDPAFRKSILSLLERGVVFAIGHIRGSSTLGRKWYLDGKFLKKKNTFEDFNACARFLANKGYTKKGNIIINGGSAGGLLVGACVNMAEPELYKAIVAEVPFVDVLNTMLDDSLPLTQLEYEQWGNPNDKEYYDYIKSYSPYDNIEERDYPAILATGGLNDPRVTYWEPMKWIYRLRDKATDKKPKLLYMNMGAGHAGASGRYEYMKEDAMIQSFMLKQFNILK